MPDPMTTQSVVNTSLVSAILLAFKFWDKHTGKRKDRSMVTHFQAVNEKIDESTRTITARLDEHHDRITDVEHLTKGVDGQNGLRGRVALVESDMRTLRERGVFITPPERPAASLHEPYRP